METASLWLNVGMLVVAAVAAGIAWRQAHLAHKASGEAARSSAQAQEARSAAVEAQKATAAALAEANDIARTGEEARALELARSVERHHVEWGPHFDWEPGHWYLVNRGPDVPRNVRITVTGPLIGRVEHQEDEIPVDMGVRTDFPEPFKHGASVPDIRWRAEWTTDLGTPRSETGSWPN